MDVRFDWEEEKNQWLINHRGYSFMEVAQMFTQPYYERVNEGYVPEQFKVTGWVGNKLYTLIYEQTFDEDQEVYFLRTYWPASKTEQKEYIRNAR